MKNTEVIQVPKAYFRDHPEEFDKFEVWSGDNQEKSMIDERMAKLNNASNLLKKPADHIRSALKGDGVALTPVQIVAKINATLRQKGINEVVSIGQVNGWLRLQGIRTDKKPNGQFQKDGAGRVSYIEQPVVEETSSAQEDLANLGKGKSAKKKEAATTS